MRLIKRSDGLNMTDALKDYDLECRKCYPETIIFNGKTYKDMNNVNTDSESF